MKNLFIHIFICCVALPLHAQLLPPNQPEQDACNALQLCGNTFFTPYSYQGVGMRLDMPVTPCGSPEANSVWLKVVVSDPGSILFSIIPIDSTDDYDFAVIDITTKHCDSILSNDAIRCNFNNNSQPNNYYHGGVVGLDDTSTEEFVRSGTSGMPFLKQIDAQAGEAFLIMVNNFGGSGGPSSGFTIDFAGSTAKFVGDGTPEYDSVDLACGAVNSMKVFMNTPIRCGSIASDGSDFKIIPGNIHVTGASGLNCTGNDGYTQEITLTLDNPIPSGTYTLIPNNGSDGNTLIDLCGEEQLRTDNINFTVVNPIVDLGPDTTTCVNNSIQLRADIEGGASGNQIRWSPGTYLNDNSIADPVSTPLDDITYVVTVMPTGRPECSTTDTIHISVLQGFDLLTEDTTICAGAVVPLSSSGDNRYTYTWTPPYGLANPNAPNTLASPDSSISYTLTASYPGCRDSSASVTIDVENTPSLIIFSKDNDSICTGEQITFRPVIEGDYTYLHWDFGDGAGNQATGEEPIQHAYEKDGQMTIELEVGFHVCPEIIFRDTVTVFSFPKVNLLADAPLCLNGNPVLLSNTAPNPPGTYRYLWNTGDTGQILKVTHPGQYQLTMTSPQGCATTESSEIKNDCYIDIPNAFHPDGDGANDYFFPRQLMSKNLTRFKMQIFNRWGQLVYETEKTDGRGWDGNFNDQPQPAGVYIYIIDVEIRGGHSERYEGNVTLLR